MKVKQFNIFGQIIVQNDPIVKAAKEKHFIDIEKEMLARNIIGVYYPNYSGAAPEDTQAGVLTASELVDIFQNKTAPSHYLFFYTQWFSDRGKMPKTDEDLRRCTGQTFYTVKASNLKVDSTLLDISDEEMTAVIQASKELLQKNL